MESLRILSKDAFSKTRSRVLPLIDSARNYGRDTTRAAGQTVFVSAALGVATAGMVLEVRKPRGARRPELGLSEHGSALSAEEIAANQAEETRKTLEYLRGHTAATNAKIAASLDSNGCYHSTLISLINGDKE